MDASELFVLHNMVITPGKTSIPDLPEFGIREWVVGMEQGQNFNLFLV
jgi:hypothetical protein